MVAEKFTFSFIGKRSTLSIFSYLELYRPFLFPIYFIKTWYKIKLALPNRGFSKYATFPGHYPSKPNM